MMKPETEAELADCIVGAKGALAICGGGTRGISTEGVDLQTSGLTGVCLYEPGALTLVAQAGTPVAEIEAVLREQNQRLAFEPPDYRALMGREGRATIGGVVAGNFSGPRRVQAGACRDFLLGVRFVDGTGGIVKNGGRVMKNVTGYDLVKLMAGSWGTLGVISEVALKVLPRAETECCVRVACGDAADAVRVMSTALGSPFEVSGAAYDPGAGVIVLRIEGFEASVAYRAGQICNLVQGYGGGDIVEAARSAEIWGAVRDVEAFHGKSGDVWRISLKPSDAPDFAARLEAKALMFDWGGGLIWALMSEGTDLRANAAAFEGHATLVRACKDTKARLGIFHPQSTAVEAISAGLRAQFDPRGILNRGLMAKGHGTLSG